MLNIESFVTGFPRVGPKREYKWALEKFWKDEISEKEFLEITDKLLITQWKIQKDSGITKQIVGDFSFYDQILETVCYLGIPLKRFGLVNNDNLSHYFKAARGGDVEGIKQPPLEMTKWFDTNYHYLVPEIDWEKDFNPNISRIKHELRLANENNIKTIVKIQGPATLLKLSREGEIDNSKKEKIEGTYLKFFQLIQEEGVESVMIDEGALGIGASYVSDSLFQLLKNITNKTNLKIYLNGFFGNYEGYIEKLTELSIETLHLDLSMGDFTDEEIINLSKKFQLSLGVIDGRSIWKSNVVNLIDWIKDLGIKNYIVSSSCSTLHSPYSLEEEIDLDENLKNILSFGHEKLHELRLIVNSLNKGEVLEEAKKFNDSFILSNKNLIGRVNPQVRKRVEALKEEDFKRKIIREDRLILQNENLGIPPLPTTTIGSFPQTAETRNLRKKYKGNEINDTEYIKGIKEIIKETVQIQEDLDLDVLVHGEAERNDMVEYFGELLDGFAFTKFGWVQSYGSRCVKPPIIYGDVQRTKPMTVSWSTYAQSLTVKPMKGMLTGPVTILQWSFIRNDISKKEVAYQIALALRDEVTELEDNGIKVIQIDEPAIREGLPLNPKFKEEYLDWAVNSFKLCSSGVKQETQIHSHMCYSEFDEILDAINALDVDVLSIEASRSGMDLVNENLKSKYTGAIGPGIYDIHSPLVLEEKDAEIRVEQLVKSINQENIWINPDCGLKTRAWPEVKESLKNMVEVTKNIRTKL